MRSTLLIAAALAAAAVVAGALTCPDPARSQSIATRTFVPLGTHGAGVNNLSSYAWFIDANDRKVVLCVETPPPGSSAGPAVPPHKVSCTSTPLP